MIASRQSLSNVIGKLHEVCSSIYIYVADMNVEPKRHKKDFMACYMRKYNFLKQFWQCAQFRYTPILLFPAPINPFMNTDEETTYPARWKHTSF